MTKTTKAQPNRNKTTRSISFDNDVFELMEERRKELRYDRSNFLVALLEDSLGILKHPELHDNTIKADEAKLEKARKARGK